MARRTQVNLDLIPAVVREVIEAELRLNRFESQKAVADKHGVGTHVVGEIVARLRLQRVAIKRTPRPKPGDASQFVVSTNTAPYEECTTQDVVGEAQAVALRVKRKLEDLVAAREARSFGCEVWDV